MLGWLPDWAAVAGALVLAPALAVASFEATVWLRHNLGQTRVVVVTTPGPTRVVTVRPRSHQAGHYVTPVGPGVIVGPAAVSPVPQQPRSSGRGRHRLASTPGSVAPAPSPVSSSPAPSPVPPGTVSGSPSPSTPVPTGSLDSSAPALSEQPGA